MSVFKKTSGTCHGRGFSEADTNGLCAKLLAWFLRPPVNGSDQSFTADHTTDVVTCAGHAYVQGNCVHVKNSGGALPGGLSADTDYYVIYIDANTFKLATSYGNARLAVNVDIASAGSGTQYVFKYGGGPGWYLIQDKSYPESKTFTANPSDEKLTITSHGYGDGDKVWVSTTGTLPGGLAASTDYYVKYVDANTVQLSASYMGATINITSSGSGTHSIIMKERYFVVCDTTSPVVNDINTSPSGGPPKFIKIGYWESESATIRVQKLCWWDTTVNSGFGYWSGHLLSTSDDADFSYDVRAGAEFFAICTRIGTTWTGTGVDEFTGDANLLEGTDKYGVLQSGITAGSSVVLQLDTGQAANFTVGNYYFIFDFNLHSWVNCCKVTATNTGADQITVDVLSQNFPTGSVIAAYAHRWVGFGTGLGALPNICYGYSWTGISNLPYNNVANNNYVFHNQTGTIQARLCIDVLDNYLITMNPTRKNYYACQRPGILESCWHNYSASWETTGCHEAYGTLKSIYITRKNSMAAALDGKTINGKNYLYIFAANSILYGGSSDCAAMFLDTESDS